MAIADVIRNCELISNKVAIAVCPKGLENQVQITAQAADELLNLNGIESSFVLCEYENIKQASAIARAMVTQYGMSEKFGLMGLESIQNRYLDGRAVMNCSDATGALIDEEVKEMLIEVIKETVNTKE